MKVGDAQLLNRSTGVFVAFGKKRKDLYFDNLLLIMVTIHTMHSPLTLFYQFIWWLKFLQTL